MDWSPPGLPGGGMTGIAPPGGVGCLISGSTCSGGQITPPDLASLSLRFPFPSRCASVPSPPFPTVACVSEGAHAFGSSCSDLGATGTVVCGGACASASAGKRATETVSPKKRISRNIEPSPFASYVCTHNGQSAGSVLFTPPCCARATLSSAQHAT